MSFSHENGEDRQDFLIVRKNLIVSLFNGEIERLEILQGASFSLVGE